LKGHHILMATTTTTTTTTTGGGGGGGSSIEGGKEDLMSELSLDRVTIDEMHGGHEVVGNEVFPVGGVEGSSEMLSESTGGNKTFE